MAVDVSSAKTHLQNNLGNSALKKKSTYINKIYIKSTYDYR